MAGPRRRPNLSLPFARGTTRTTRGRFTRGVGASTVNSEPDPSVTAAGDAARPRARTHRKRTARAVDALTMLFAGVAFRDLLTLRLDSAAARIGRVDWFFEPSETAPLVVILMAAGMLWRRWRRLAGLDAVPRQPIATALLLCAGFASFVWAIRTGASDLLLPSLALNLLGIAVGLAGVRGVRSALLPAGFLGFAMPLPAPLLNHLIWKLQFWTAELTGALLDAMGVAVLVSGDQIVLADRVFGVIETCSGLRSIVTLTMLAVLMAHLFHRRRIHALLLIVAAPPIAFAINGIRATALVLNPHSDVAAVHTLQGVMMLLGGVALLYVLDGVIARRIPEIRDQLTEPAAARPESAAEAGHPDSVPRRAGVVVLMAGYAAISLWLPAWNLERLEPRMPATEIPVQIGGWTGVGLRTDWMFLGQTAYGALIERRYTRGDSELDLFIGINPQSRDRSAFSPKTAYPGSGWIVEQASDWRLGEHPAGAYVMRKGPQRTLILHWRLGASDLFTETLRTFLALDASPLRREGFQVVIRLTIPFSGGLFDRKIKETELADFAREIDAGVKNLLTPRGVNR